MTSFSVKAESWPIAGVFTISRGSKTSAEVVVVKLTDGSVSGWAECVPYARYGETVPQVIAALEASRSLIEAGLPREQLPELGLPMAAANALDCALWDLEAKSKRMPAWQLAGLSQPKPLTTAYTISLAAAEEMAEMAARNAQRPLLKLKLGREGDEERLHRIRAAAPASRLIIDANEGWGERELPGLLRLCADLGVELVEQPLPAADDGLLASIARPVRVCADESAHSSARIGEVIGKYDAVNIKLDKTGGLTEALRFARLARSQGLQVMAGCMVGTSLAMAPAMLLGEFSSVIDLDGPLLLARDREPAIHYDGSIMQPAPRALWG